MKDWLAALEAYGYRVPQVSYWWYRDWCFLLSAYVSDKMNKDELALLPLFHFVVSDLPTATIAPELDDANAELVLRSYNNAFGSEPPQNDAAVDFDTMGTYLAYLVAARFLAPPPSDASRQTLPICKLDGQRLKALASLSGRIAT